MRYLLLLIITLGINTTYMQAHDTAVATFGGGCFWCTEAIFSQLKGVEKVESGYSGGELKNPSYKDICTGLTGHAEVIHITYQPALIEFVDLLEVFFATHDPTTLNRQGADIGTQYRSVIFYHNQEQKLKSEFIIQELNKQSAFDDPIVTEVSAFEAFYPAEEYHQDYYSNNKNQPYCRAVVGPKVEKFKKAFADILKD